MSTYEFVNGYQYPKFEIYDSNNNFVDTFTLHCPNESGMVEEYETKGIVHDLLSYERYTNWKGYHIYFTINYDEWTKLENTLLIKNLMNYIIGNYKIFLYPRSDNRYLKWEVVYMGDTFSLGILKGGLKADGNYGIVLKFRTKYIQTNIKWMRYNLSELTATIDVASA